MRTLINLSLEMQLAPSAYLVRQMAYTYEDACAQEIDWVRSNHSFPFVAERLDLFVEDAQFIFGAVGHDMQYIDPYARRQPNVKFHRSIQRLRTLDGEGLYKLQEIFRKIYDFDYLRSRVRSAATNFRNFSELAAATENALTIGALRATSTKSDSWVNLALSKHYQ